MSNILIFFDHKENSRLLFDYLSHYHTVLSPEKEDTLAEPFDLVIFDGKSLDRLWRKVDQLKAASQPLFLPLLLVTGRQEISFITRHLWQVIDELIVTPIDKTELLARVEILLRARRLSLELQAKNLELEQEILVRQETEQALRESEDRFRVALQTAPLFVAHTGADLNYTWAYNADRIMNTADVGGKGDAELLPPDAAQALTALKQQAIENELGVRGEIVIRRDDAKRFYDVTVEPLLDVQEDVVGTTIAALDITERKISEAKSREVAALEERQQLARDLHDSVNQTLFTLNLIAESLPQMQEKNPEHMWEQVDELRRLSQSAMAEMRTLLLDLRPASVVKSNLSDLFVQLIRSVQARRNIDISSQVTIDQPLFEDVHIALYRIVQEALNNMSKHSDATQGSITLIAGTDGIHLRVWDNGRGFDTSQSASGMGLGVMRERASFMGANFVVNSSPESGTEIVISASTEPEGSID